MASIHYSPYAGSWYPGEARELRGLIESVLEISRRRTGPYLLPNPIAFVVPHAGLQYSGTVAAAVYRHLQARKPQRVVLLGFSHRGGPAGVAIPDVEAFTTPAGRTRIDDEASDFLLAQAGFHRVEEDRICDHSVEIQLPLLQQAAPDAALVPLYVGPMTAAKQESAARSLAALRDGTVFVASSDLTHYGRSFGFEPFPADETTGARLAELDRDAIDGASSLDAELFLSRLEERRSTVCGRAPIALLLRTLARMGPEEIFQETLDYQTSGELTGDFHHSVSYGALGYFPASSFELAPQDRERLLESVRATLQAGHAVPPVRVTLPLTRRGGVYVTLRADGKLRGCVGTPAGRRRLAEEVPAMAVAAACEDPRFEPVAAGEAGIEAEISLLSPLKRIGSRDSFRLFEHGAHLSFCDRRSLLLPQVAQLRNWSAERFWNSLAAKCGLTPAVYGEPETRLHVFRAQKIA